MRLICILLLMTGCSSNSLKDLFFTKEVDKTLDTISEEQDPSYSPTIQSKTDFTDSTESYGLAGLKAANINAVDFNQDGYTDLVILPDYFTQPQFYQFNSITKKFELLDYSPFAKGVKASYIMFYDLDRDYILDALVGVLNQKTELAQRPIRLFKGIIQDKRLFFKETVGAIPMKAGSSASMNLIDFDLDGDLDLFIGNWFGRYKGNPIPEHDVLLENDNGKYKLKTSRLSGENQQNPDKTMYINATPTYASSICDIDQNGFPDILTASTNGYANKLWMNRYRLRQKLRYFQDFGRTSLYGGDTEGNLTARGGGRTFATSCADYNNDGIMDVFLGELYHNYDNEIHDKSSILTGARLKFPPRFLRTEYFLDSEDLQWHQADRRGIWFDYNHDGLLDLMIDNSGYPPHSRMILFKQLPDHSFVNVAKEVGIDLVNPHSTIVADFNRDGKMDILTAQSDIRDARIKRRLYLFENNGSYQGNYIRIYPRGKKSNWHALGAMIILKVTNDGNTFYRRQYVDYSQGGLPPQNEEGILFGLQPGDKIEFIKVRWPYTKRLNQNRAGLEQIYNFQYDLKETRDITLCENGDYLIGKRNCR
jgi:hypothetical protein